MDIFKRDIVRVRFCVKCARKALVGGLFREGCEMAFLMRSCGLLVVKINACSFVE